MTNAASPSSEAYELPADPTEGPNEEMGGPPSVDPRAAPDAAQDEAAAEALEGEGSVREEACRARQGLWAWGPVALVATFAAVFFTLLPPLSKSGLWDPHELANADLARRIAAQLFGAAQMSLAGTDDSLPHLNDLGRPELPFLSMALGFRFFGLSEWAGRLPMALWGFIGCLVTYGLVARLVDRRAGVHAALALATMPLFFVQARTMMGEIVTMTCVIAAFGGLVVGVFDRDDAGPRISTARFGWLALGVLGLLGGYFSRGVLLGVVAPTLGVGLAWVVARATAGVRIDRMADATGAVSLVVGAALAARCGLELQKLQEPDMSPWLGAMIRPQTRYPTFDIVIGQIGHAAAPWSAFVPVAIGRLFRAPFARAGASAERESALRSAVLLGLTSTLVAHGLLAARTSPIAFAGAPLLAVACALAIRDYERGAPASIALGATVLVFAALFHHDFHTFPEKAFGPFAVAGATFPDGFKQKALALWWVALGGFAAMTVLAWAERDAPRVPFSPRNYARVIASLRRAGDGIVVLTYLAAVIGAALAGLLVWWGTRQQWKATAQLTLQVKGIVQNAWWIVAIAPPLAVLGAFFAADVFLWAFNRARPLSGMSLTRGFEPFEVLLRDFRETKSRAERTVAMGVLMPLMALALPAALMFVSVKQGTKLPLALAIAAPSGVAFMLLMGLIGDASRGRRAVAVTLGGIFAGLALNVAYYPALAAHLSPKDVFDTYARVRKEGEPLGLLGVGGRTAAYYSGGKPLGFGDAESALAWLMGGESAAAGASRRYLAVKADDLPRLNAKWRERSEPRSNVPVIDGRSSSILLVASRIEGAETTSNPFDRLVLTAEPRPHRPLDVNLEDKLQILGIDVTNADGRRVDAVSPGKRYHLKTYLRVLAPIASEWKFFIHIDGFKRRHNGDHDTLNGKYPMALWLKDDVVVDDHEFGLEPNFTPGAYTIFLGLFIGDSRMRVKSGPSDGDNRVNAGTLVVQ
jgi:hypothetical protein